jgi:hypothetical protein
MPMNPRLLVPRATGFNPKSLPGLKIWLDAGKSSSLTMNGGDVAQMDDLSGNGFHASQGTGANQPTLLATGFNGKPTLEFDLTDSLVSSATIADYFLTPTTSPTFVAVMACYMPDPASSGAIVFGSDAQANGRLFFASHFGGSTILYDTVNVTTGRVIAGGQTGAGWTTPHILTVYRSGAVMSVRRDGVEIAGRTNASGNYSSTTAQLQIGKCDGGGSNVMYLSEMLVYGAALSETQITAAESGLARKWGITLAPQVSNADAQDWVNRVYANGGTVSPSTAAAVNTFCNAIDAASIRDRFYRMNLFCGNSDSALAAVRTPLYRGPSLGGTQYGNALDTNNNFVQGDYAETGVSGGLIGNTTTKYLDTGLATDALPQVTTGHLSFWTRGGSVSGVRRPIGTEATVQANRFFMDRRPVANGGDLIHWGSLAAGNNTDDDTAGLFSGSRTSATDLRFYKDGVQVGTTQTGSATMTATDKPIFVFAGNLNGTPAVFYERRMAAYSIGDGMTASQMLAYYNALNTFMGALSRT